MAQSAGDAPASAKRAPLAWGVGVALALALVLVAAYAGHRVVSAQRQAGMRVGPPGVPFAIVERTLRPGGGVVFAAPSGAPGQMVLAIGAQERSCPTFSACGPVPNLDHLALADITTGTLGPARALEGAARRAIGLVVDPSKHLVALISPGELDTYALDTLRPLGALALPGGLTVTPASGAATGPGGVVLLTASMNGQPAVVGLDDTTGQLRYRATITGATALDGPLVDASRNQALFVAQAGVAGTTLQAFSATTGTPLAAMAVPEGARLGPLDAEHGLVYLFAPDGTTLRVELSRLNAGAEPTADPTLGGAVALGWNAHLGHTYMTSATGIEVKDSASGRTLTQLPIHARTPPQQALLSQTIQGRDYVTVLAEHNDLLVVSDAAGGGAGMTADTAALLARAALPALVPGGLTPQDPPFVSAQTYLPGPGLRADVPFEARDPDVGWQSAGPGSARTEVTSDGSGGYQVIFTTTWTQHQFTHQHVSVLQVAASGAVSLVRDGGDVFP